MTLKTKLSLGLGFLFMIILALVVFSSIYIGKLAQESSNILKDNYDSLVYSKNMFYSLDDMTASISSILNSKDNKLTEYYLRLFETGKAEFEKNLKAENNNITEIHEKEYVDTLNRDYDIYSSLSVQIRKGTYAGVLYFTEFLPSYEKLRHSINNINDVNMQAVVRKNQLTIRDSVNIISIMAVIGAICIILAFGYFWYFPVYISNSISYLSNKMKELLKNTGIKLDMKTSDEAFIILQSINLLDNKFGLKNQKRK